MKKMESLNLDEAYQLVYEDMIENGNDLLFGICDKPYGWSYLDGIKFVMNHIAIKSNNIDEFNFIFNDNKEKTLKTALNKLHE